MIKRKLKKFLVIILMIMLVTIHTGEALAALESSQPSDNGEPSIYAPDINDYSGYTEMDLITMVGAEDNKDAQARQLIHDFYNAMIDTSGNLKSKDEINEQFDTLLYNLAVLSPGIWNAQILQLFLKQDIMNDISSNLHGREKEKEEKEFILKSIEEHIHDSGLKTEGEIVEEEQETVGDSDPFAAFIDGIAGLIFYPMKIMPAMLGYLLKIVMNNASGNDITIENILFNRVDLTDINFFKEADTSLPNAETINAIRDNVAIWYYSIRNLAAVALGLILVYIGIRMAISTVAEDKAKYKTMFVDWATSLCLLFVLQFIILATININEAFVNVIKPEQSEANTTVEDQLWSGVWGLGFVEGLGNSIAYLMLVGMSFIYFFAYVKRMITIAFLIIISPLITITYSIDKMGDGKSQALNTWLKEFVYNILIQPFQCIIYLSLVTTVFKLLEDNGLGSVSLINVFIAVYVLMFMFQAEEIVKKIFGFQSESMGKTIASAAITTALISSGTKLFKGGSKNTKNNIKGPSTYKRPNVNNNGNPTGGTSGGTQNGPQEESQGGQQGSTPEVIPVNNSTRTQGTPAYSSSYSSNGRAKRVLRGAVRGLVKANIGGGLRIAGTALGLSTGKLETGAAGYGLGAAASQSITGSMNKSKQKYYDGERRAQVARDIDAYQNMYGYNNAQAKQNIDNWLDGLSVPDRNDDAGLQLYQHLIEERQALEDTGLSVDDARARLDKLVSDTFTGQQSRLDPKIFQGVRDSFIGRGTKKIR